MGQCYSVVLKLIPKKTEHEIIGAFGQYVLKDKRTNWNLDKYLEKGYTMATLDGCMTILLSDQCIIREDNVWRSDFNGSYGWQSVMVEAFKAMAPALADESYIEIYPDSGRDKYVVMKGKAYFEEDKPINIKNVAMYITENIRDDNPVTYDDICEAYDVEYYQVDEYASDIADLVIEMLDIDYDSLEYDEEFRLVAGDDERYEATLGPNSKQWWLYDNETDEYVDPPKSVLDKISEMPSETADDLDKQGEALLEAINHGRAAWLYDGNRYDAEDYEI